MTQLRIGLIGVKFGRYHVRTFAQMDDVQLVAIADRHPNLPEGLEAFAQRHGAKAYDDGVEMIAREPLDAVSICTSPGPREALIRAAAERGLPMIIEKPWAADLVQARRLAALCHEAGARVMTAFSFRFLPTIRKLRELMDGELGQGWVLNGEYVFRWLPPPDHWLWNPRNGGGFINENTCHLFDAICYLLGRPISVMAEGGVFMGSPSEEAAAITLRFESGAIAALTCGGLGAKSFRDYPRLDVITANGQAKLAGREHMWDQLTWALRDDDAQRVLAHTPETALYTRYSFAFRHFVDCVRAGAPLTPTVEDGVRAVALAMATYESARTGRRVLLSD